MLSGHLVHTIESHWEDIAARVIHKIRENPELPTFSERTDAEIREWCKGILANLSGWLSSRREEEARRRFEAVGSTRYDEHVPLHEAVLRFHLLKEAVIDFVHEEWMPENAIQLYAEEELGRRVSRFFDSLVYYVVYGYEKARNRAVRYA